MHRIKILYFGLSPNLGGIENYLYNLYTNIDKKKFEVSFLIFNNEKVCYYDELCSEGVRFFEITHRNKNYRKFLMDLKNVYKNNAFDYIHLNFMSFSCFETITYARKYSKAKIIVHSHTAGHGKNVKMKTRILDYIGRFMTRNIKYYRAACSEAAGRMMFGNKEFTIFNNGIDVCKYAFNPNNRNEIRSELNIPENIAIIGNVGMFETVKNHTFLVKVFYEYHENKKSKLVLIGEGRLMKDVKNEVEKLGISNDVLFLGRRNDTYKIYSAMDYFIMPSLYEGISLALIEAQANGLKCLVSDKVDKKSDVTGNVKFLPLKEGSKYWANCISDNLERDNNALNRIPDYLNVKKSCDEVYEFYTEKLVGDV